MDKIQLPLQVTFSIMRRRIGFVKTCFTNLLQNLTFFENHDVWTACPVAGFVTWISAAVILSIVFVNWL